MSEAIGRGGNSEAILAPKGETAAMAMAAKNQAMVQAAYLVARSQPRDWLDVRANLLEACKRPKFAERARYAVPRGSQKARGFSIRFAEEAVRAMGNLRPETITVYDDDDKRIVSVTLTDLERNVTWSKDVTIQKRIERRQLRDGQVPIAQRVNSDGHTVYVVKATDDEMLDRENALVSKAMRTHALRQVPADILEECEEQVAKTLQDDAAKDPKEAAKKLADAFATLGVKPGDLKSYLGADLSSASPAQIAHLREVYTSIKDGNLTWREVMAESGTPDGEQPTTLKEKVQRKAAEKKQPLVPASASNVVPLAKEAVAAQAATIGGIPNAAAQAIVEAVLEEDHICMAPKCGVNGQTDPAIQDAYFCHMHGAAGGIAVSIRREWAVAWPHTP